MRDRSLIVDICGDCGGYITDSVRYGMSGWDTYVKRDKHECDARRFHGVSDTQEGL